MNPTQSLMLLAHAPFCQVMAGLGAPEVSQCKITDMPSITALSEGPAVMLGAIPMRGRSHTHTQTRTGTQTQTKSGKTEVIMRDINSFGPNKADGSCDLNRLDKRGGCLVLFLGTALRM